MFRKLLIANRGEIACRIMRTAKRMGLRTVAVYSDADRDALHALTADEAVHIGEAPASRSYLDIDRIVRACLDTGADAVHPGYGFLSENARFAKALSDHGIAFIGPPVSAIEALGDKLAAKRIARAAGVSTVPGHDAAAADAEEAVRMAREIGYPVMLKAAAGGGGKGMRLVRDDRECRDGFARAVGEATSAFGDGRLLVEKYIDNPRHIEIQILGDAHGHVIHLGERECSLQRRHQKVVEEAPSPFLDDSTRRAMGEQAVALAQASGYHSAGTVEFIVDSERHFYFLEVNTRLQVEHPVTELITGMDLVEWMIRIAAGEPLTLRQEDVRIRGWAIEGRVYAEDPLRNFLPSTGRLVRFAPPSEADGIRVDTGIYEGAEVTMFYDPMIAKVIAYGIDRSQAIDRIREALNMFTIRGVAHNISFLAALIEHPRFRGGRLSTNMIAEEYPQGFRAEDVVHDDPRILIAVAATLHRRYMDRAAQIAGQMAGYERFVHDDWVVVFRGQEHPVRVRPNGRGHDVDYHGTTLRVESDWQFGCPLFQGTVNGQRVCIQVERRHLTYRLFHWGSQTDLMVLTARAAELYRLMPKKAVETSSAHVLAPLPGLLAAVWVKPGDDVCVGQDLAVVEAMKMENVIRSPRDGKIGKLLTDVGSTLSVDQPILEFA